MARWLPGLVTLALLPLGGCAGGDRAAEQPFMVIAGPEAFVGFELRSAGEEVLWHLVADEPVPLRQLVYGDVPAGFRQEAPVGGGRPRSLMPGEPLTLQSVTPLRVFLHEGFAASGQRFSIDYWEMRLRSPPEPPALDGVPVDGAPGAS
jgi:hypothetical protein